MTALLVVSALLLLFYVRTLQRARAAFGRPSPDRVTAADDLPLPDAPPRVSVLIAARDEAEKIGAALASLLAQDYPDLEIIVVDDRSTDATSEIVGAIDDPRVTLLRTDELPDGWFGKPRALHLGAARASGEWLLLTDADVEHRPRAVRNGLAHALRRGAEAASFVGERRTTTFIADLVTPQLAAYIAAVVERRKRANQGDHATWGASVGFFLVQRAALERAGGFEAVRAEIAEDTALAARLHAVGARYVYGVGSPTLWHTEAYPTLREMFHGFERNEVFRLGGRWSRAVAVTVLMGTLGLVPVVTMVLSAIKLANGGGPWLWFGVLQYPLVVGVQMRLRALGGVRAWPSVLAPIGALVAWAMMMMWFVRGRRRAPITWKGRRYPADPPGAAPPPSPGGAG